MLRRQRFIACVLQDIEALRIGLHQSVLDAIVDHLDEVPGPVRSGMQVALPRPGVVPLAAGRRYDLPCPRRERAEDRIEPLHHLALAADHQAIAALQSPYAATGPDIEIVDAAWAQRLGARDVVFPE